MSSSKRCSRSLPCRCYVCSRGSSFYAASSEKTFADAIHRFMEIKDCYDLVVEAANSPVSTSRFEFGDSVFLFSSDLSGFTFYYPPRWRTVVGSTVPRSVFMSIMLDSNLLIVWLGEGRFLVKRALLIGE